MRMSGMTNSANQYTNYVDSKFTHAYFCLPFPEYSHNPRMTDTITKARC